MRLSERRPAQRGGIGRSVSARLVISPEPVGGARQISLMSSLPLRAPTYCATPLPGTTLGHRPQTALGIVCSKQLEQSASVRAVRGGKGGGVPPANSLSASSNSGPTKLLIHYVKYMQPPKEELGVPHIRHFSREPARLTPALYSKAIAASVVYCISARARGRALSSAVAQ